jgi:tRNA A37 threonylcarbamoyladenosine dehydratase
MFDRLEIIIQDKINILKSKTVLLIGLGGVGGSAFEALVRSGIGKIIVIDNDTFDITNLNRQALAYQNTISQDKVLIAQQTARNINPNCQIIPIKEFINEENINKIFEYKIDFIIDAIDTVNTKKLIIKNCLIKNIPFISVMGTGNKMHPELLEITDIRKTSYDPIAKIIRKMIKDEKTNKKVPVVYSKEKPLVKGKVGSTAFVPPTAGMFAASYVINKLIEE